MNQPIQRRLLKTKQAADYFHCSPWEIRELVHDGKLNPVVFGDNGGAWRFDVEDLDKFIDSRKGNC